jgi:2,3-bisphosphoglycerate-independent phosphoglycerate mutase
MSIAPGPRELPVPSACLIVLDGWGLAQADPGNAVSQAQTPVFDELWAGYPHTQLTACGRAVGLPEGQMGNSEVGHLNLGAGSVVVQDLSRINDAVADGSLEENEVLRDAFAGAERVHLLGLVSDGGVHASMEHLRALIDLAAGLEVPDLVLHCFTDGRDTLPTSGAGYLETVAGWCKEAGTGRIASVVGRYFAMDRDGRWDRTQRAYDLLVHGRGEHRADTGADAVRAGYEREETDEFITPTAVGAEGAIRSGDSVVCFNFRPDRVRQLTRALAEPAFGEADEELPGWVGRDGSAPVERYTCLTEYEEGWPYPIAFPPERPEVTLGGVLAAEGVRQLHVAETEKYPHVTYFFNGGEEAPYEGERREMVPSPRDVPTYDHKPEMSAAAAAAAFVEAWSEDRPGFGIINFANADMVGHTGVIAAAVTAIETVDRCLVKVVEAVHGGGGVCVITADHGNADHMLEPDGSPNTAHSLNPVPLIVTVPELELADGGVLADVAPTVLALLGIEAPSAMGGRALITASSDERGSP